MGVCVCVWCVLKTGNLLWGLKLLYVHMYVRIYIHTLIHTYKHTHTNTHTHIYITHFIWIRCTDVAEARTNQANQTVHCKL